MSQVKIYPRIPEPKDPRINRAYLDLTVMQSRNPKPNRDFSYLNGVPKISNGLMLDVACGGGKSSFELARDLPDAEVIGIDLNPENIESAKSDYGARGLKNLEYRLGNAYYLARDYRGRAQTIHIQDSLHHLDNIDEAIRQFFLSLVSGGLFVFRDLNREGLTTLTKEMEFSDGRVFPEGDGMYLLRTMFSDDEILSLLFSGSLIKGGLNNENIFRFLKLNSFIAAYTPEEIEKVLASAGFGPIMISRVSEARSYVGVAFRA